MNKNQGKVKGGNRVFPFFTLYFSLLFLLLFLCVQFLAAQAVPVGVMPFAGDDPALNSRLRAAALAGVENLADFNPRPLDAGGSFPDSPPDPTLLEGAPYVLTGEYYFDDEDMLHFQMWLWNGASGALVYTDELAAENADEAEGYVPSLAAWVFSKIPIQRQERAVVVTAEPRGPGGNGSPRALKVPYPDVKVWCPRVVAEKPRHMARFPYRA